MKCLTPEMMWHGREPVLSIDFQPHTGDRLRLASGGSDNMVLIWYISYQGGIVTNIKFHSEYDCHFKPVNVVRFAPTGGLLASGDDDGTLILWNMKGNDDDEKWVPLKVMNGRSKDIYDISWSADGNYLITASTDNISVLWNMKNYQVLHIFSGSKGYIQGVSWDPLNKYMASIANDCCLQIMSVKSKKILHKIRKAPWSVNTDKGTSRGRLFHDDTLQTFYRRLCFTPDGELLIVPSGIYEKDDKKVNTTYIFSRHSINEPVAHLPSGDKFTVAARCNPLLYQLRITPENRQCKPLIDLPYRMIFAIAASDYVAIYDTEQLTPCAKISNIHYANLTDLAWSSDGRVLVISSSDGYCTIVSFKEKELGEIYVPPVPESPVKKQEKPVESLNKVELEPVVIKSQEVSKIESDIVKSKENTTEVLSDKNLVSLKEAVSPAVIKPNKPKLTIENFFKSPKAKPVTDKQEVQDVISLSPEPKNVNDKKVTGPDDVKTFNPMLKSTPVKSKKTSSKVLSMDIDEVGNDSCSIEIISESVAAGENKNSSKSKVELNFAKRIKTDVATIESDKKSINKDITDMSGKSVDSDSAKNDIDWKLELSQDEIIPMDTSEPSSSKIEVINKQTDLATTPKPKRRINLITLSKTVSPNPQKL